MPYYWRNWRRPWTRRWRRRTWRRRIRGPFRRNRRKRYYRVRKKLKTIRLKEWQPSHIKKLCVKGLYCLWQANRTQLNKNWAQYEASVPREGMPNGGGYSLLRFTLETLFEQHELVKNVWTKSNKYFPLFRYNGCTIRVYRPENVDALVKFQTCYPMSASNLLYMGSQPSIMLMSKGCKKIRCKKSAKNKKPYVTYRLPPPQQMTNKWLFQSQHSKTGLLLIQSTAASFDQYYVSRASESATITLITLNTKIFKNLNFKSLPTYGYMPNPNFALYASNGNEPPTVGDLIWVGNTIEYGHGKQIKELKQNGKTFSDTVKLYMQNRLNWANPFHRDILSQSYHLYWGPSNPLTLLAGTATTPANINWETKVNQVTALKPLTQELYFHCRYNPNTDKGYDSKIYLKSNWKDPETLDPPTDTDLITAGFPAWLSCWGFVDYHIKLGKVTQVPTHYLAVHISKYIQPKLDYYIFVDKDFIEGNSEYYQGRTGWDDLNWYPMTIHQDRALETLAQSGPGTAKLGDNKSAECKIEYRFYFKVGGCATPVEKVANPSEQPYYNVPSNILDTNSLQSPEEPCESFLYQFDWRRNQITESAAQRISKDYSIEKYLFTDGTTTTTATEVPTHKAQEKELLSSEEEEAQAETLFEQLQLQRNKQKQLRYRIKQLLTQLQNTQ
nr:MAG: ORF1 [TTV-like mini virus]